MHIDFDLKTPCPVARIFLLLSGPGHAGRTRRVSREWAQRFIARYFAGAKSRLRYTAHLWSQSSAELITMAGCGVTSAITLEASSPCGRALTAAKPNHS
jgi:hypothetical protein